MWRVFTAAHDFRYQLDHWHAPQCRVTEPHIILQQAQYLHNLPFVSRLARVTVLKHDEGIQFAAVIPAREMVEELWVQRQQVQGTGAQLPPVI